MVFIAVAPSLERAAVTIRPAPLAERVCKYEKIPSLCVHPQGQDRNYDSAVPPCLLCYPPKPWPQSPSRRANTPLPCNGGFRPKLLKALPCLPGPRRPTNLCPAFARLHCPGSLQMRCAGSLPSHRFDCIIHFIFVKSRGIFKFLFFGPVKVILLPGHRCCGACGAQSRQRTPPTPELPRR